MFHICQDEIIPLLSAVPWIGYGYNRFRNWLKTRKHRGCHCRGCAGEGRACGECAVKPGIRTGTDLEPLIEALPWVDSGNCDEQDLTVGGVKPRLD